MKGKKIIINIVLVGVTFLITILSLQFQLLKNDILFIIFEIFVLISIFIYFFFMLKNDKTHMKKANVNLILFNCCGIVNLIMLLILFLPLKLSDNMILYDVFLYIYLISGYIFYIFSITAYFYPLFFSYQEKQFRKIGNFYQRLSKPLDTYELNNIVHIIMNKKQLNIFLRYCDISNYDINFKLLKSNLLKLKNDNIYAFSILKVFCEKRCESHLWQGVAMLLPLCFSFNLSKFQVDFNNKTSNLNIDFMVYSIGLISILWIGWEVVKDIRGISYIEFYKVIREILKEI